jgi:hypothetical protein
MIRSKFFKWVVRGALIVLLVLIVAAGAIYLAASSAPGPYRPADLTAHERGLEGYDFLSRASDFRNQAQDRFPFTLSLTQEQINKYLASMDETVALVPNRSPGEVRGMMERAGLEEPCVAVGEGVLTLMVRLSQYDKVLSADVSFDFLPDGKLQVRLREVRLGRLPVPQSLVRGRLAEVREKLVSSMRPAGSSDAEEPAGGVSIRDVSALLRQAVAAIDEQPISTDLRKFPQRIEAIELHDKTLKLRFTPTTAARPEVDPQRRRR